jgi:hypothetical protein
LDSGGILEVRGDDRLAGARAGRSAVELLAAARRPLAASLVSSSRRALGSPSFSAGCSRLALALVFPVLVGGFFSVDRSRSAGGLSRDSLLSSRLSGLI